MPVEYNIKYMWTVPPDDKDTHGTLLSDRIRLYVDAVHLIEPATFDDKSVRPASYDLHVGDEYYVDDDLPPFSVPIIMRVPGSFLAFVPLSGAAGGEKRGADGIIDISPFTCMNGIGMNRQPESRLSHAKSAHNTVRHRRRILRRPVSRGLSWTQNHRASRTPQSRNSTSRCSRYPP